MTSFPMLVTLGLLLLPGMDTLLDSSLVVQALLTRLISHTSTPYWWVEKQVKDKF